MSALRVFVCLLATASALTLRGDAASDTAIDDEKDPIMQDYVDSEPADDNSTFADEDRLADAEDAAEAMTCSVESDVPVVTLMSLADDEALNKEGLVEAAMAEAGKPKKAQTPQVPQVVPVRISSLKPLGETVDHKNSLPKDADLTKFVDAVKDARKKKQEFAAAQAKLLGAMEGLLEVPAADRLFLAKAANGALGQDSLITFYAPWCPHCQTFVLHDGQGNPRNAPLEVLRRDLKKDPATKNVIVSRADMTKIREVIPEAFDVVGIPTVYFVTKLAEMSKFVGNAHDPQELKDFVKGLASH